jgi:HPt (histidine-containing phosphotransfer) domain-containing protein
MQSLKSTARIMGARELSSLAEELEKAGLEKMLPTLDWDAMEALIK